MPRTPEGIVENFRAATELRRQGKPIWRLSLPVKPILHEGGTTPAEIIDKAKKIAKLIKEVVVIYDPDLAEIVEWFGDLSAAPDANELDEVLDRLYDWADKNRVWIS